MEDNIAAFAALISSLRCLKRDLRNFARYSVGSLALFILQYSSRCSLPPFLLDTL